MQRAQATVEYVSLLLLAALLAGGALLVLRDASALARAAARAIVPRLGHHRRTHTPDQRALENPRRAALVARALPTLVLERDVHGDDDELPVDDACAAVA